MEHFVTVVDSGSFSKAAERLRKNASSVARQVDRLEQELQTRLFIRSTRRLELTLDGESFYHQCVDILQSVRDARQSFLDIGSDIHGEVMISVFDTYGQAKVVPLLPEFQQLYPNTRVAISLDNALIDLHASPFDLAIRYGRPTDSNLIGKTLVHNTGVLVASPAYLDKHGPPAQPEALKEHRCLTLLKQRQHVYWYFRNGDQYRKVRIDSPLSSCGGAPLLQWVREGIGLTLLPHWFVDSLLETGELVEVMPEWEANLTDSEDTRIQMLWKPGSAHKPVVRAMIDFLTGRLESLPYKRPSR
ncbi:LysR family transcriptional regulator [Marinobacterium ramblicola]|uniref:LysR family transcriptional regulator n=1 Tax=Marinobacterium ramblicola TaxID=2849041 RepID=UPI001FE56F22|nr:LysR family transcriptional regulator [Marinobacterium ramblicola]